MSTTQKLIKSAQRLIRNVLQLGKRLTKQVMNWLLRNLFVFRRHANTSQAGFVLPTVIMVLLVVTLLTTAILFRSFDRAKNASNVRINQATLSAATPALDRAKAKIEMLLADPNLPRGTPGDSAFSSVIETPDDENEGKYNKFDLPGETRLQITDPEITDPDENTGTTGWLFPVDTDNNGKFDSVTVYSILYKYGEENEKTPLKARSLPMTTGNVNPACAAAEGTSASLIGGGGWVDVGGTLKKSIFVYVATVPITDDDNIPGYNPTEYEIYQKGNKGFSALEMQVDIPRIPLSNNAVVYEDDVEIFSGGKFNLNGRIYTNSNLFVTDLRGEGLTFRQVSSPDSCFYEEENSKMVAGGHVGYGTIAEVSASGSSANVHLFKGRGKQPDLTAKLSTNNQSATQTPAKMAYNNNAYEQRIARLVAAAKGKDLPEAVDAAIKNFIDNDGLDEEVATEKALDRYFRERTRRVPYAEVDFGEDDNIAISVEGSGEDLRPSQELMYPYNPGDGKTPTAANVSLKTVGNKLKPAATKFATQEQQGTEEFVGDRVLLGHNLPELRYDEEEEEWLGKEEPQDIVGTVWDEPDEGPRQRKTRVTTLADAGDTTRNGFWENAAADQPKDKFDPRGGLRVVTGAGVYLPDLAPGESLNRSASNIVWPDWMPVINPANSGTGIPAIAPLVDYLANPDAQSIADIRTAVRNKISAIPPDEVKFSDYADALPPSTEVPLEIDITDTTLSTILKRPFKRMNAAAVYHYNNAEGKEPIACVATYYDPTDWQSARNLRGAGGPTFADVSGDTSVQPGGARPNTDTGTGGARSVNGITFEPPTGNAPNNVMRYLRNQVYPNGRWVNPMLREATGPGGNRLGNLNLAQQAAYDSTNCALHIYGELSGAMGIGTSQALTPTPGYSLPHGTIQETAFLDARQIKAVDGQPDTTSPDVTDYTLTANYDLPIEQRYPLEIRATVLDLDQLRQIRTPQSPYGDQEYMLPNSGIIYATRDDALPDASDDNSLTKDNSNPKLAATDFLLDPTRRPNGIMLVNGARLWREREFRQVEKGLTVATNLPVYIKAQPAGETDDGETLEGFNPHQNSSGQLQQEFTKEVTPNSSDNEFYGRTEAQLNDNFACRRKDPRLPCPVGDEWRPATVLSDGITLLSSSFREGFRNEGDYDLRNNQIDNVNNVSVTGQLPRGDADGNSVPDIDSGQRIEARRLWNGFWNNDFAIDGLSSNRVAGLPPATDGYPSPPTALLDDITPAAFPTGQGLTDQDYSTNDGTPLNSSYFNNMVTPVQRRVAGFPEYVMEYCPKTLVSECQPTDWIIGLSATGGGSPPTLLDAGNPEEANSWDVVALNYSITQVGGQSVATDNSPIDPTSGKVPKLDTSDDVNVSSVVQLIAGTTATPPQGNAIGKPRRIAFLRDPNGDLIFDGTGSNNPIPLGIAANGTVQPFPYGEVDNSVPNKQLQFHDPAIIPDTVALKYQALVLCRYRTTANTCDINAFNTSSGVNGYNTPRRPVAPLQEALWYASFIGADPTAPGSIKFDDPQYPLFYQGIADEEGVDIPGNAFTPSTYPVWPNGQPRVVPVVQLQATTEALVAPSSNRHKNAGTVHWLPSATESPAPEDTTIFNLVLASKDSPSRPAKDGHEGDIGGALHLMPRFLENWNTTGQAVQIDGSFIQIGRSFYATAPYFQLPNKNDSDNSLFGALGYPPFYRSGNRNKLSAYEGPGRSFGFDVGLLSQIPDLFGQNFAIPSGEEPSTFFREVSRDDPWLEPLLCAQALDERGRAGGFVLPDTERPSRCR